MEIILASIRRLWRPLRWPLIVAVAPAAFGSTYWVTREFLPLDSPLWGSAIRALPAGIVLMLVARRLPRSAWWWRATVLGTLNMGLFFCLVYIAAQMLVGVIGLLNPITGVAVGMFLGAESLSALQTLGIALALGSIVFVNIRRGRAAPALTVPDRILDSEEVKHR